MLLLLELRLHSGLLQLACVPFLVALKLKPFSCFNTEGSIHTTVLDNALDDL